MGWGTLLFTVFCRPSFLIMYQLYLVLCLSCYNGWIETTVSSDACWEVCLAMLIVQLFVQVQQHWHKPISQYKPCCKLKSRFYDVRGTKKREPRVC
jgi:hypothetical protein